MLIEHFSLNKMLNMDIFVRVKIENNRIDFSSLLSEKVMSRIIIFEMLIFKKCNADF